MDYMQRASCRYLICSAALCLSACLSADVAAQPAPRFRFEYIADTGLDQALPENWFASSPWSNGDRWDAIMDSGSVLGIGLEQTTPIRWSQSAWIFQNGRLTRLVLPEDERAGGERVNVAAMHAAGDQVIG